MTTISDIARVSGVSISTVSRVLNGNYVVSKEKREKVLKAMKELGYVQKKKDVGKGEEKTKKTIIVITSVLIDEIIQGIQDVAEDLNYEVLIKYYNKSGFNLNELFDNPMYSNSISGVIILNSLITSEELEEIIKHNIPVIQTGQYLQLSRTYSVTIDDEEAGYDTTKHLIEIGKKKIAFIGISSEDNIPEHNPYFTIKRYRGYRSALEEFNIPFDNSLVFHSDNSLEDAATITEKIIKHGDVDGILASSDHIAIACIETIKRYGLDIPKDIAVVGFDNLEISEFITPKLTTVSQPFYDIGAEAVNMLDSIIKNNSFIGKKLLLDHTLIKRESTAQSR